MSNIINFHRSLVKLYKLSHMRSNRPFFNKYYNKKILDKFWDEHTKYADNLVEAISEGIEFSSMKYLLDMCISLYTLKDLGIIKSFDTYMHTYTYEIDESNYQMQLIGKNRDEFYITLYANKDKPYINKDSKIKLEYRRVNSWSVKNNQFAKDEYDYIMTNKNNSCFYLKDIVLNFRVFYFNTIVSSIYQDIIKNVEELEQLTK